MKSKEEILSDHVDAHCFLKAGCVDAVYDAMEEYLNQSPQPSKPVSCDAMGHYGADPTSSICPKCGKPFNYSPPEQERLKTDCNIFIDRAIEMMKDINVMGWNVAGYNGVLSLLTYAKESHSAAGQATPVKREGEEDSGIKRYKTEFCGYKITVTEVAGLESITILKLPSP